jgi:hypothetical protein
MIDAVMWMVVGGALVIAALVAYAAWDDVMYEDERRRRDAKHRCHHKWTGQ